MSPNTSLYKYVPGGDGRQQDGGWAHRLLGGVEEGVAEGDGGHAAIRAQALHLRGAALRAELGRQLHHLALQLQACLLQLKRAAVKPPPGGAQSPPCGSSPDSSAAGCAGMQSRPAAPGPCSEVPCCPPVAAPAQPRASSVAPSANGPCVKVPARALPEPWHGES